MTAAMFTVTILALLAALAGKLYARRQIELASQAVKECNERQEKLNAFMVQHNQMIDILGALALQKGGTLRLFVRDDFSIPGVQISRDHERQAYYVTPQGLAPGQAMDPKGAEPRIIRPN